MKAAEAMPTPTLSSDCKVSTGSRKVMFLIRSLGHGGAERQLCLLAARLHAGGCAVQVVTFYAGGALRSELEQAGVPVASLGKRGRWDLLPAMFRLVRIASKSRPDVLYTFLTTANILGVLLRPWLKQCRLIWGIRASDRDLRSYDWLVRASGRVEEWLARRPDCIISNSTAGKQACLARRFPADRFLVIPNGIDADRFRFDPVGRRQVRAQWRVPDDALLVGLVARRVPKKGHLAFLRAAELLRARMPSCRFVCVGEGPDTHARALQRVAKESGLTDAIIWDEGRDDMAAVYSAFDVVCSSSCDGEGFPNAIAEAMACERACVVTDVGDSARIVGESGIAVPPRDPAALAHNIESLAALGAEARAELGRRARARIETKFTVDALVTRTLAAFEGARGRASDVHAVKRASARVE